jgi:hypothetical protein
MMKRIEPPAGWTKTTRDLAAEKRFPTPLEWEWAQAYELTELRKWARFPRDGEIYEAIGDTLVEYLINWDAPVSSGGAGMVPKGTRVRVSVMAESGEPVSVYADPLDYARIERELIPEGDRSASKYVGFSLSISTADLNRLFRRILSDAPQILLP